MKKVDKFLSNLLEKNKTPSVQYLVFDQDELIHKFQKGWADLKNKKKVNDQTTYSAFSITKTFTALAILQLVENGKLHLDDSASKHLPDFPYPKNITIQHLLTHSSGIPNPNPLSWIHLESEHASFDRNLFFQSIFQKNKSVKFRPNEKFMYSNLGYILLGQIIEVLSGKSYEEFIKKNIFEKLDLPPSELSFTFQNKTSHAKGYHRSPSFSNWVIGFFISQKKYREKREGKWQPFKNIYINGTSYGGLIATPNALMKYGQTLLNKNGKLVNEDLKKMLFKENFTNNQKSTGMCFSWFTGDLQGEKYYCHAGGGGGFYCEIRIYHHRRIGSLLMFNRSGMRDERFLDKVDKLYFEDFIYA